MKCMMQNALFRYCESTSREWMWEDIIRRKSEEFKELYELVAVVDIWYGCSYKKLHEVNDIIWELVDGLLHDNNIGWKGYK